MNQLKGGGWNSSLAAGVITMANPLPANEDPSTPNVVENAIDVQFLLGVASSGNFRFYVIVEALP
jgi:hypothetical protein